MKLNKDNLKTKGWTEKEIEHAEKILLKSEEKLHPKLVTLEKTTYWLLLIAIVFVASIIAWIIQPFLMLSSKTTAIITVILAGLIFGSVACILLRTIEKIEFKHHLTVSMIVPISAITTSLIMIHIMNNLVTETTQFTIHNPYLYSILYGVFALIPYFIYLFLELKKKNGFI